ncbi:Dynein light chain, cytoplasmic [Vitis vinifera]|uniref:Dynein light chain, cytoplasmic n=1 Tax=Vitis vinifera TaxID=29760 RepID=A0A438EL80_VITVI|nr:Dynein light chain, cytoplasmic [Vitis vinifera]
MEMGGAEEELERRSKFLSSLIQKKKATEQHDHSTSASEPPTCLLLCRAAPSNVPVTTLTPCLESSTVNASLLRLRKSVHYLNLSFQLNDYESQTIPVIRSDSGSKNALFSKLQKIGRALASTIYKFLDVDWGDRGSDDGNVQDLVQKEERKVKELSVVRPCEGIFLLREFTFAFLGSRTHLAHNAIFSSSGQEFDSLYGPAWHCIVGTSFGSYVTHSLGGFLYFSIDKVYILLFKTAVEPLDH